MLFNCSFTAATLAEVFQGPSYPDPLKDPKIDPFNNPLVPRGFNFLDPLGGLGIRLVAPPVMSDGNGAKAAPALPAREL